MKHRSIAALLLVFFTGTATAETIPAEQFEVAGDLRVTAWATTPQLFNPTNFDVDGQGRMWVTEAVNYREFRNAEMGLHQDGGDRVVVLEDTDNDGQADSSHTFVRDPDLIAPLGISVIDNKVIVSCSPNVLIYTDVDRDAKFDPAVDKREVFLTGFEGVDHDHSLHSVTFGPDGYYYLNVGNGGAHTVTDKEGWTLRAGSSYSGGNPHAKPNVPGRKSDDGRVWVGGVAMRIRPDGTGLEPIGHNFRNSYEQTVTSFGDVFQNDNDDPPACRTSWLMEYGNAGFSSADGQRSWRVDQRPGQSIRVAEWRQEDPGVMPAGDIYGNGAPTGIAYYENGALDSKFSDGLLLSCESARGVVFGYVPKPLGAGFALERFDFLKLKDNSSSLGWFRPSDVGVGPEGAIYVADWYDPGVGGHRMSDTTASGTIYRIAPKNFKAPTPAVNLETDDGRVAALCSPALSVRALGFSALKERGAHSLQALIGLLNHDNKSLAARAIWLLPYAGDEGLAKVTELLAADEPMVQVAAMRSLRRSGNTLLPHAEALANSNSPMVRRELAIALRDIAWEQKHKLVESIAGSFDGWDPWYLEAIGTATEGDESNAYAMLVATHTNPLEWDRATAELAWRLHPSAAIDSLTKRAMHAELPEGRRKRMINALAFIADEQACQSMLRIAKEGPEDLRGLAAWWGHNRQTNSWAAYDMGKLFPPAPAVVTSRHGEGAPKLMYDVAGDAIGNATVGPNMTGTIDVDVTGAHRLHLIVDQANVGTADTKPTKKNQTTENETLADWINPILVGPEGEQDLTEMKWISASRVSKSDAPRVGVNADRGDLKVSGVHEPGGIGVKPRSVISFDIQGKGFTRFKTTVALDDANKPNVADTTFSVKVDRSAPTTAVQVTSVAETEGNASHGKALFFSKKLNCYNCHMVEGYGGEIGPDLTQIASKHARPVLFEAILKPSAAISTGFETISILTVDGQIQNGLLISNGNPVVIKDAQGKLHSFDQDDIELQKSGEVSIMPEMKELLTAQETADLVAYLQQVAKPALSKRNLNKRK